MNSIIDENGENRFANSQSRRDLRVNLDFEETNTQLAIEGLREGAADSDDRLEALRKNPDAELDRRIELPPRDHGISSGDRWFRRIGKRAVAITLLVLALAAIAPFVWNYLQSYESTDDAQIDGHIDPLSSRIDGTVIAVHAEDDDRVKAGELLVDIHPPDYESAEESSRARLRLAVAQGASPKPHNPGPRGNIR